MGMTGKRFFPESVSAFSVAMSAYRHPTVRPSVHLSIVVVVSRGTQGPEGRKERRGEGSRGEGGPSFPHRNPTAATTNPHWETRPHRRTSEGGLLPCLKPDGKGEGRPTDTFSLYRQLPSSSSSSSCLLSFLGQASVARYAAAAAADAAAKEQGAAAAAAASLLVFAVV